MLIEVIDSSTMVDMDILGIGTILKSTDYYKSTSGKWSKCPCAGLKVLNNGVTWVRPIEKKASGGAFCSFDAAAADRLKQLLGAVAAYASGGREALLEYEKTQAKLDAPALKLTDQMNRRTK